MKHDFSNYTSKNSIFDDKKGNLEFKSNRHYEESNMMFNYVNAEKMPGSTHLKRIFLYEHFISNQERLES